MAQVQGVEVYTPTKKRFNNYERPSDMSMPANIRLWAKITHIAKEIHPSYPDKKSIKWAEKQYKAQGGTWK